MGEAKRRGTYEQRRKEAEAKRRQEVHARLEVIAEKEKSLTPEARAARRKAGLTLAVMTGMFLSSGRHTAVGRGM